MATIDSNWISATVDCHWQKYRKRLKACRKSADEEAVHKLRTSTRRLLALIELLQQLAPQASLRKSRKILKAQLDEFDQLRDIQVMRLDVSFLVAERPELAPFLHHLHVREQGLLMQTPAVISSLGRPKLARKLKKSANRCQKRLAGEDIALEVTKAIDGIYRAALERYRAIDPGQPASLHRLRISVKKLRYTLILAQTLLPGLPENHPQRLQNYLTSLGDIQNSQVLIDTLRSFHADAMPESLHQYVLARQQALVEAYWSRKDELATFWRASPEQSYPWLR